MSILSNYDRSILNLGQFQWLKRNNFLKTFGYKKNYDEIFLKIYKAMIQPVFSYCGTFGLCFSLSRISRIESIERRSQKVIAGVEIINSRQWRV